MSATPPRTSLLSRDTSLDLNNVVKIDRSLSRLHHTPGSFTDDLQFRDYGVVPTSNIGIKRKKVPLAPMTRAVNEQLDETSLQRSNIDATSTHGNIFQTPLSGNLGAFHFNSQELPTEPFRVGEGASNSFENTLDFFLSADLKAIEDLHRNPSLRIKGRHINAYCSIQKAEVFCIKADGSLIPLKPALAFLVKKVLLDPIVSELELERGFLNEAKLRKEALGFSGAMWEIPLIKKSVLSLVFSNKPGVDKLILVRPLSSQSTAVLPAAEKSWHEKSSLSLNTAIPNGSQTSSAIVDSSQLNHPISQVAPSATEYQQLLLTEQTRIAQPSYTAAGWGESGIMQQTFPEQSPESSERVLKRRRLN